MAGKNLFDDEPTSKSKSTKKSLNLFDDVPIKKVVTKPIKPLPIKKVEPKKSLIDNVGDFLNKNFSKTVTPTQTNVKANQSVTFDPKKLDKVSETAGSFTANLVDSATLGFATKGLDKFEKGLGTKSLENASKNNKVAATIGNLTGYAVPFAGASKVVKPLAKNLKLAKKLVGPVTKTQSVANKVLPLVVSGAGEGALVGGAEAKIKNNDVLKSAGQMAALGVGGNLAIAGAGKLISKALKPREFKITTPSKPMEQPKIVTQPITPIAQETRSITSTNANSGMNLLDDAVGKQKVSQFRTNTVERATKISNTTREMFPEETAKYTPEQVASWQEKATKNVETNRQAVESEILNNAGSLNKVQQHEAAIIAEQYEAEALATGDSKKYIDFLKSVTKSNTETGRNLKAIDSAWDKKTKTGAIMDAIKTVDRVEEVVKKTNPNKIKSINNETNNIVKDIADMTDEQKAARLRQIFSIKKDGTPIVRNKTNKNIYEKVDELIKLGAYDKESIRDLIKQKEGLPILDSNDIKFITENMDKAATFPEGSYEQRMLQDKVGLLIQNKTPSTGIEKFQAAQRISMLFNPKSTVVRNPLGNALLNTMENVKNIPTSAIDKGLSAIRGSERTTIIAPIAKGSASIKGAKRGLSEWRKDIINGVDTSPVGGGVELPNKTKIFNEDSGNLVSRNVAKGANKVHYIVGKALKVGDTPFYNAAYEKRLAELKIINKSDVITDAMKEDAHLFGLERTLQNDSAMASIFTGVKQANFLNKHPEAKATFQLISNLIMPFAKTPANILDKFMDYSVVGAGKALTSAALTAGKGTFNQKKFVDQMGRSLTGTGLAVVGYLLAKNNMITGARDKNSKVEAFESATGKSNYAFKIGNEYYTVDWALPAAAPLMMGADIYKATKESKNPTASLTNGASSAVNLLFNSTLLQGPSRLMGGYNPAASLANGLMGTTTQATPTFGKQIAQLVDPVTRETYSPNPINNMINKTIARIPFASKSLPAKIDITGKEIKAYDGNNSLFNVLLNPGFKTTEKKSPGIDMINKVYNSTGDEGVIPKLADKKITYKNKNVQLSSEEYTKYQKWLGTIDMKVVDALAKKPEFNALSDEDKAKAIKAYYDKINSAIKLKMLMNIAKERDKK